MKKSKLSTQEICLIGMFTAIIIIMAQISIPMPLGVPMTMQTFAITLAGIILGAKNSAISCLIYALLGGIGIPVFSGLSGGFDKLIGPTGGYILAFPLMAFVIGYGTKYAKTNKALFIFFLTAGTVLDYVIGTLWFCAVTGSTLTYGFSACVVPFIPTTIIKAILAASVGLPVRKRVVTALYQSN